MSSIQGDWVVISHAYGGCTLNDPALTDWPNAIKMGVDQVDGWRQTADLNVVRAPRGVGDGDYIANRFPKKSRMLTISGYIMAATRADVDTLFDLLVTKAFPQDIDITLRRNEPIPKYVVCRLAGGIDDVQYMPEGMRWSATVLCADPLKYDAVNTLTASAGVSGVSTGGRTYPRTYPLTYNTTANGSNNQVTLVNAGTASTYPKVTVVGPLPSGWRVENSSTGDYFSFDTDLAVTDVLVVDCKNKMATLNGSPINGLISGEWWPLRTATNIIRLYGNYDPAAGFTITAQSAWR
jgi:hypothetical protein